MGRRSDHTPEQLQDLVLSAARGILADEGLRGLSARRLAARIGYSVGTLYNVYENVDEIVLVSDEEMRAAARWLWFELGIAAELSGAAALAALLAGRVETATGSAVTILVCGAGTDGLS